MHTSLVAVAETHGHEATHVTWLGLGGAADRDLMPRIVAADFTFVTNNARDFRKLYAAQPLHAGLVIIVPQVPPAMQRALFDSVLGAIDAGDLPINEAIEVERVGETVIITRYGLPGGAT